MEESTYLEFKRQYTENIKKEIVAFLNAGGGKILIGIDDDGSAMGIEDTDDCMLRVINSVRSISPDAMSFVKVQPVRREGKTIIEVEIEVGPDRPYYLRKSGQTPRGVYLRIGPSCQPMSRESILKMIEENGHGSFEENRSIEQKLTFTSLNKKMDQMNMPIDRDTLLNMHILDEADQYTNLGLLLSDECPYSLKAAYISNQGHAEKESRKEFTGSTIRQIDEVMNYLSKYNKNKDYPEVALQEVVMNMFLHRDYSLRGSNYIYIYDDHMEFRSRGELIHGITTDTVQTGFSESRNRYLSEFFAHLQLATSYGTGISKMMKLYDISHQPIFNEVPGEFVVTFFNMSYTRNIMNKNVLDEYDDEKKLIMNYLETHSMITRLEAEQLIRSGSTKSYKILTQLLQEKKIEKISSGRNTKYIKR